MQLRALIRRLALGSLALLIVTTSFGVGLSYAAGPVLPTDQLCDMADAFEKDAERALEQEPKDKKACRKLRREVIKLRKRGSRLKRLIRNKTTKLRQDPNFDDTTEEIVKLQNKIKKINDLRERLLEKRRQLTNDLKNKNAAPLPAAQAAVDKAVEAIAGASQVLVDLQAAVGTDQIADLDLKALIAFEVALSTASGSVDAAILQVEGILEELYGLPATPKRTESIIVLQEVLKQLREVRNATGDTFAAVEEATTAVEEVAESNPAQEEGELCSDEFGNLVPCIELA